MTPAPLWPVKPATEAYLSDAEAVARLAFVLNSRASLTACLAAAEEQAMRRILPQLVSRPEPVRVERPGFWSREREVSTRTKVTMYAIIGVAMLALLLLSGCEVYRPAENGADAHDTCAWRCRPFDVESFDPGGLPSACKCSGTKRVD